MGLDVVFMGTPEFAVPALRRLAASKHAVRAVVTAPDRPRGRGHAVRPTPVAIAACELGIPVLKPESIKGEEFLSAMRATGANAVAVVAYGKIIPSRVLAWPKYGCVNVHPSLLPKYRGASPIHAPLLAGDSATGVTTMYMDEGLDTGDILLQEEVPIAPGENAGDLHDRLATLGAELLVRTFDLMEEGLLVRIPQDHARASYAPKVEKEKIPWELPAHAVAARINGLSPHPGAYTLMGSVRLKALRAVVGGPNGGAAPGRVVEASGRGIAVACGSGSVVLLEVQPEGKAPMSAGDFARGYAAQLAGGLA